jgi:hypothetical protein
MAVREVDRVLEYSVETVITASKKPVASQARRIVAQYNAWMLRGPRRRIAAVCCLVRAPQCLALVPQFLRMLHPLWRDLPGGHHVDFAGRMQCVVIRAPRGGRMCRCALQRNHTVSVLTNHPVAYRIQMCS